MRDLGKLASRWHTSNLTAPAHRTSSATVISVINPQHSRPESNLKLPISSASQFLLIIFSSSTEKKRSY